MARKAAAKKSTAKKSAAKKATAKAGATKLPKPGDPNAETPVFRLDQGESLPGPNPND